MMDSPFQFQVHPVGRFAGESQPVRRPKEFTCFSYDKNHQFILGDSSMKWYYPPSLGADLSLGFETFDKLDEEASPEHVDSLLKTIAAHEQKEGKKIDAQVVTWRGIMTKLMAAPFENRDGFDLNATLYQDCVFIEEDHQSRMDAKKADNATPWMSPIPREVMTFWGYKFEALSTLPTPWGETSRDYIENRDKEIVDNKEQYCSIVRTGIGKTILCLGGEVDAIWDSKPTTPGCPINWVELKTSAEIRNNRDRQIYERKLLKWWAQSFLLGVPRIIVGFRTRDGVLASLDELETAGIPAMVQRGTHCWDGNACINFCSAVLEWIRNTIGDDDGVYRIRRRPKSPNIEIFKVEEAGHGQILTDEFINWRIKLSLGAEPALPPEEEDEKEIEES